MMKVCLSFRSALRPKTDAEVFLDTREEDLTHPEDIAHFAKHEALEDAADRQDQLDKMSIIEQNIPQKFRRNQ